MTEAIRTPVQTPSRREALVKPSALLNAVALAVGGGLALTLFVLFALDGWSYYATPLGVRGYEQSHAVLRPSGSTGHLLGILGTVVLLSTLPYVVRKRVKRFAKAGSLLKWLEFHIFCGVFGPILITLHTSFKFNGLISVAFWSMAIVVASGFIGRLLYVRIPKTLRGDEMTRAELEARAGELAQALQSSSLPEKLLERIRRLDESGGDRRGVVAVVRDELRIRRETARLRNEIGRSLRDRQLLRDALETSHQRALLLRRIERLQQTRKLFHLWHAFHRPLVWVMFLILIVHLAVAVYFGYTYFGGTS